MFYKSFIPFFAADAGGTGGMTASAQPNMSSTPVTTQNGPAGDPTGPQGSPGFPPTSQNAPGAQVQQEETFESLIKGKYKTEYDQRVKKAVMERLKCLASSTASTSPIRKRSTMTR